jgi:hypothetical protein
VSDEPYVSAIDVLRVAVASGLPGAQPAPTEAHRTLTFDVLAQAENHRVQGLVWSALERGDVVAGDDVRAKAHEDLVVALRRTLMAESWACAALAALDEAGVPARALKGLAIAHLDHVEPGERVFADADLMVRRTDLEPALAALVRAGFARLGAPSRVWWERRFGKAVVMSPPGGGEVDLHLTLASGYFGARIPVDELWRAPGPTFDLGGRRTEALDAQGRLLHACCHGVLGGWSGMRAVRDVAQLVLVSGADWRTLADTARSWGVELLVAEGIRQSWEQLHLDPTHPAVVWAGGCQGDERQRQALVANERSRTVGWSAEARTTLHALSPMERALFLAGVALPGRASRRYRRRSLSAHVARGWGVVRAGKGARP